MSRADSRARPILVAFAAAVLVTPIAALQLQPQAVWLRADSPSFVVIGDVDAGALRDVAIRFEGFREVLGRLNARLTLAAVPTVITVPGSERTFAPFRSAYKSKPSRSGALFLPGRDVNHIIVPAGGNPDQVRALFLDYAQVAILNFGVFVPPALNEELSATPLTFSDMVNKLDPATTPVAAVDAHALLADMFLQLERPLDAAGQVASAAKLDPTSSRVRVSRARVEIARRDYDHAAVDLRRLPISGDWFLDYMAGVTIAAAAEGRPFPPTPEDLRAARLLLHRAPAGRDPYANSMARMAALEVYSTAGPSVGTRVVIERARVLAPGRHDYALLYAQVLARLSEFAAARGMLGPMMTPGYPQDIRDSARALMGRIVELEAAVSRVDEAGTKIRPSFREVRPGEQRLEGVLETIECIAADLTRFRVRSGAGLVTVEAARLTDVDFIAYRSDFKGSVTCGPQRPAMPVYVTWRSGATPGSRIAAAIEFLPK